MCLYTCIEGSMVMNKKEVIPIRMGKYFTVMKVLAKDQTILCRYSVYTIGTFTFVYKTATHNWKCLDPSEFESDKPDFAFMVSWLNSELPDGLPSQPPASPPEGKKGKPR